MITTLIITGCINPVPNQEWLCLKDAEIRLNQYIDSIRFYIDDSPFTNIIFCDNSNYSYKGKDELIAYAQSKCKNLEWISFAGDAKIIERWGKSAGEDEIVSYVLKNSVLVKSANEFAKVTGRLKLVNVGEIVRKCMPRKNYFIKDVYRANMRGVDTRFYIVDKAFFMNELMSCYERCSEDEKKIMGTSLEEIYFKLLRGNYKSFGSFPKFIGVSAGNGRDYGNEPRWQIVLFVFLAKTGLFNIFFWLVFLSMKIRYKFFSRKD